MKSFHQLTVTERDEMRKRFDDFNQKWLKVIDAKVHIDEQEGK